MVPPRTDPRWALFIKNLESFPVSALPTRMFMSRLRVRFKFDSSDAAKEQAIQEAYEFFAKNSSIVQDDIKLIFG